MDLPPQFLIFQIFAYALAMSGIYVAAHVNPAIGFGMIGLTFVSLAVFVSVQLRKPNEILPTKRTLGDYKQVGYWRFDV